jgi:hypothetical protein
MSSCVSKRRLRIETLLAIAVVAVAAVAFYFLQNRRMAAGGEIAVSKLFWLAYAILCWYVLPVLIVRDGRAHVEIRRLYAIFFADMALRGLVELPMIYCWRNWHPYYGAAHDGFSIVLIGLLATRASSRSPVDSLLKRHVIVIVAMLAAEIKFALYFAANFHTLGAHAVYYVPNNGEHSAILRFTTVAVALLTIYLGYFTREWLYGANEN